MNAGIGPHSVTRAATPVDRPGRIAISGGGQPVPHQRARFTVGANQRGRAAGLIQQVPDLAKIVHALLAQ